MKARRLFLGGVLAVACDVARPEHSFLPSEREARPDLDAGVSFDARARVDGDVPSFDPPDVIVLEDGAVITTPPDGGEPTPLDPAVARLARLSGRYLMRVDLFSTAHLDVLGTATTLPTRVSYLYLSELGLKDGQLVAGERLCWQTFLHACSPSCTATSTVDPASYASLWALAPSQRTFTLEAGELVGSETRVDIGFTGSDGADALPTSARDTRVWDAPSGGAREGFQVIAAFTSGLPASCTLSTVQRLGTALRGPLGGSELAPSIGAPLRFDVDSSASVGATIALGAGSNVACTTEGGAPADPGASYARFVTADGPDVPAGEDFWRGRCPDVSLWESALPGDPP